MYDFSWVRCSGSSDWEWQSLVLAVGASGAGF